ncbi:OLC1v1011692C1 [Oldenlandia corymbosa var. corymbosa]|uniref:OLC1v1011692C1 n=1 Tax=Oldenlandia corymbosa var. corymbosa TaxID=529605 RepID=A0AAV1DW00_OLDCO|nr:OLC1v1011692C1 [Oldenlandia corymbosa var. corymbosa]
MPPTTTVDEVTAKLETTAVEAQKATMKEQAAGNEAAETEPPKEKMEESTHQEAVEEEKQKNQTIVEEEEDGEIPVEVETKTGVSFPIRLEDKKQLKAVGLRKKSMLGVGIKIYAFGIYADNEKLKALMRDKFGPKAPAKPTKEMYQMVIDSDIGMRVRLVIVFSNLTMSMVRKNFDEGLGAAIKKLTGSKNDDLTKK